MEVDHVWPKSKGGPNHRLNYQTLCRRHNRQKGARYADYRLRNLLVLVALLGLLVLISSGNLPG
jgi:5-methylcytosine-specific restriction endonuclease McrA